MYPRSKSHVSMQSQAWGDETCFVGTRDCKHVATRHRFPPSLSAFTKTSATPAINEDNLLILTKDNLAGE